MDEPPDVAGGNLDLNMSMAQWDGAQHDEVDEHHGGYLLDKPTDDEVAAEWFGWGSP